MEYFELFYLCHLDIAVVVVCISPFETLFVRAWYFLTNFNE